MNVLMLTNTFRPHVGGVARSVEIAAEWLRHRGHRVLIGAPTFPGSEGREEDVIRIPAIQHFNGSDFSVPLPVTGTLHRAVADFEPRLVHSHHPFLLGDTALRVAAARDLPIVFTHHTMYEQYTRYAPIAAPLLQRFAVELATSYANLCDAVFAPSESVAEILRSRGVTARIEVVPTGVDLSRFVAGNGGAFRRAAGIPMDAPVVGHVGRLAAEKNLRFLARTLADFACRDPRVRVLVVGSGPEQAGIRARFAERGAANRLHLPGLLQDGALADAYRAMNVFAFASKSETQGLVLAEALAAGVPLVAVDAPGAREVVEDGVNGRLLGRDEAKPFEDALAWVLSPGVNRRLSAEASRSARTFSTDRTQQRALTVYADLPRRREHSLGSGLDHGAWSTARRRIREEWAILAHRTRAATHSLGAPAPER
jgi:glycosyltransferase involved in cell wall biosynthesis